MPTATTNERLHRWITAAIRSAAAKGHVRSDHTGALRNMALWSVDIQALNDSVLDDAYTKLALEWMVHRVLVESTEMMQDGLLATPRFPWLPMLGERARRGMTSLGPECGCHEVSMALFRSLGSGLGLDEGETRQLTEMLGSRPLGSFDQPYVFLRTEDGEPVRADPGLIPSPARWLKDHAGNRRAPRVIEDIELYELTPIGAGIAPQGTGFDLRVAFELTGGHLGLIYKCTNTGHIPDDTLGLLSGRFTDTVLLGRSEQDLQNIVRNTVQKHPTEARNWRNRGDVYSVFVLDPTLYVTAMGRLGGVAIVRVPSLKLLRSVDLGSVSPSALPAMAQLLGLQLPFQPFKIRRGSVPAVVKALRPPVDPWIDTSQIGDYPSPTVGLYGGILYGPSDVTRSIASRSAPTAIRYATEVDRGPHPATMQAALAMDRAPYIEQYAATVPGAFDEDGPRSMILSAIGKKHPAQVIDLARTLDRGPREDTRKAALSSDDPYVRAAVGLLYAVSVDGCQHPDTRMAALQDPYTALLYDLYVIEGPTEDGRMAACRNHRCAYLYALHVDKAPSEITLRGVTSGEGKVHTWIHLRDTDLLPDDRVRYRDGKRHYVYEASRSSSMLNYAINVSRGPNEIIENALVDNARYWPGELCCYLILWPERMTHRILGALATPQGIEATRNLGPNEATETDGTSLMKKILSTRARRAKVIGQDQHGDACFTIAKFVDGGKRADTYRRIVEIAESGSVQVQGYKNGIKRYYEHFIAPKIPEKSLRRALGLSHVGLTENWSVTTYHDGGWGVPSKDYDHEVQSWLSRTRSTLMIMADSIGQTGDKDAAELLVDLGNDLTHLHSVASEAFVSGALKRKLERCLDNDTAGHLLRKIGLDRALWWYTHPRDAMFAHQAEDHTNKPLESSVPDGTTIPPSAYLSIIGAPRETWRGGCNVGMSPTFRHHRESLDRTMRHIAGLDEARHHGEGHRTMARDWLESLDARTRSYVRRRLGRLATDSIDEYISEITFVWYGATVLDAVYWSPSPFVMEVELRKTPYMNCLPYSPDGVATGWLLFYPGSWTQIAPDARYRMYHR